MFASMMRWNALIYSRVSSPSLLIAHHAIISVTCIPLQFQSWCVHTLSGQKPWIVQITQRGAGFDCKATFLRLASRLRDVLCCLQCTSTREESWYPGRPVDGTGVLMELNLPVWYTKLGNMSSSPRGWLNKSRSVCNQSMMKEAVPPRSGDWQTQ